MSHPKKGLPAPAGKPRRPRAGGPIRKADVDPRAKRLDWRWKFLAALAKTCSPYAAAEAAGVSARTTYRHRAKHARFRLRWEEALEAGLQLLEVAARQRALDPKDPASATLMIFLMKAHRPQVYRERPPRDEAEADEEIGRRTLENIRGTFDLLSRAAIAEFGEDAIDRLTTRAKDVDFLKRGSPDERATRRARGDQHADVDWSDPKAAAEEVRRVTERLIQEGYGLGSDPGPSDGGDEGGSDGGDGGRRGPAA